MIPHAPITSYYSFKGGVGRSVALANEAAILASSGRRVLVIDFDLEAPGLHRYLRPVAPVERGVIDLFYDLHRAIHTAFQTEGSYDPDDPRTIDIARALVATQLDRANLFQQTQIDGVTLLPAGSLDAGYGERIQAFEWRSFFEEFAEVFGLIREELRRRYDAVLIDSRTGMAESASVSTVALADSLVLVFCPNEQSLVGAVEVARSARAHHTRLRATLRAQEPLRLVPLLSRVDHGEAQERDDWVKRAAKEFRAVLGDLPEWRGVDLATYFEEVQVPHSAWFAYGERVAALERVERGLGSVFDAFSRFSQVLQIGAGPWLDQHARARETGLDNALMLDFDAHCDPGPGWVFAKVERVPDEASAGDWTALRRGPTDLGVWREARRLLDAGIRRVTAGGTRRVHVFGQMPYGVALLLGRRLDDLARAKAVTLYVLSSGQWLPIASDAGNPKGSAPIYDIVERTREPTAGSHVIVSIEGVREVTDATLDTLAAELGAATVVRVKQQSAAPLSPNEIARGAEEIKATIRRVHARHTDAVFHLVSTAPVVLLVELGRAFSPTVYRSVQMHSFDPLAGRYTSSVDVLALSRL